MKYLKIACVAGVKRGRGRGNLGARERVGHTREKEFVLFASPFSR